MAEQAVPEGGPKPAPVVIKKYANRRLYNTATSAYVTLEHLSQMVKDKTDFVVYDAKTGDEITRSATKSYQAGAIDFYQFAMSIENSMKLQMDYYQALAAYNQIAIELNYISL